MPLPPLNAQAPPLLPPTPAVPARAAPVADEEPPAAQAPPLLPPAVLPAAPAADGGQPAAQAVLLPPALFIAHLAAADWGLAAHIVVESLQVNRDRHPHGCGSLDIAHHGAGRDGDGDAA